MSAPEKPDTLHPEEAERRRNFRRALCLAALFTLIGVLGVMQTGWFVRYFTTPRVEAMARRRMRNDREKQERIGALYREREKKEPVRGLVFDPVFSVNPDDPDDNMNRLERAREFLLNDQILSDELRRKYGATLRDVNALVVPGWHLHNDANQYRFGFKDDGWEEAQRQAGSLSAKGFTIRDKEGMPEEATEDGTPRIVLNYYIFTRDERQLRLTLLHEMLHALNLPKYSVCPLNRLQSDLIYLEEYRGFLERKQLKEDFQEYESLILWASALILVAAFYQFVRVLLFAPWNRTRTPAGRSEAT